MVAGSAVQKLMMNLPNEQEIVMNLADMLIETYVCESMQLRVEKLVSIKGEQECALLVDMMRTWLFDSADRINKAGKDAITSFAEGDELRIMLSGLRRFTKTDAFNTKDARRRIAVKLVSEGKYCF